MTRVLIVVAVAAAIVAAKVYADRRRAALADRSSLDLPPVPAEWRGRGRTWLVFATRYCATCGPLAESLRRAHPGDEVRVVPVEAHTDLAARYHVRTAPTLLEVGADGRVVHSLAGIDAAVAFQRSLAEQA